MSVKSLPTAISSADARPPSRRSHPASRIVRGLLLTVGLISLAYASASVYVAIRVVHADPLPVMQTPAASGLSFREVTFPSREDHLAVRGWGESYRVILAYGQGLCQSRGGFFYDDLWRGHEITRAIS